MRLTLEEIAEIKLSLKRINARQVNLAKCFYDILFEMAPLLKPLFKSSSPNLAVHFNALIQSSVDNIDTFSQLQASLFELGKKHRAFGVDASQFPVVKSALLLAIQQQLKLNCTELTRTAWSKYYDMLSEEMLKGINTPT